MIGNLQHELSHNVFDLMIDQVLRESPNLKNLVSAAIDDQVVILNTLLKDWIKEEFGRFGPALEANISEKFQLLEHGLKAQSDQLFRILNDQIKVGQQQSLTAGSGRASGVAAEQAAQVNLVLAEVKKQVQEHQRRLGSAQELGAQLKLLFTLFKAQQGGLERLRQEVVTRATLDKELEAQQTKWQMTQLKSAVASDNGMAALNQHMKNTDLRIDAFMQRMTDLERENQSLKVQLAARPGSTDLVNEILMQQAALSQRPAPQPEPVFSATRLEQQAPIESAATAVPPGRTSPTSHRRFRLVDFDDLKPVGDGLIAPLVVMEEECRSFPEDQKFEGITRFMVAPVETSGHPLNSGFLMSQLGKESVVPKFSGEPCEFDNLCWEFNRLLIQLEKANKEKIAEETKHFFLEKAK